MKVVLTTVKEASCEIEGNIYSSINRGYLLLVGFTHSDTVDIAHKMADKLLSLRVFPDSKGNTNLSLDDVGGDILSISQFTLYGDVKDGRRPSFTNAKEYHKAEALYNEFNSYLMGKTTHKVETGVFGADMDIRSTNSGPFTLILDSEELFK